SSEIGPTAWSCVMESPPAIKSPPVAELMMIPTRCDRTLQLAVLYRTGGSDPYNTAHTYIDVSIALFCTYFPNPHMVCNTMLNLIRGGCSMSANINVTSSKPSRVLMVAASPSVSMTLGTPVGFWASELTHPYYAFTEVGYVVTLASPNGGRIEMDAL